MMIMYHYVYKTVNLVNGKFYIGVHSSTEERDSYIGSGKALQLAIRKYGKDQICVQDRIYFDTRELALEFENLVVDEEFCKRQDTYNMTVGGGNPPTISGQRPELCGRTPWNKGKKRLDGGHFKGKRHSEESRKKISAAKKGYSSGHYPGGHNKGKVYSAEEKRKKKELMKRAGTDITQSEHLSRATASYWKRVTMISTKYKADIQTSRLIATLINF